MERLDKLHCIQCHPAWPVRRTLRAVNGSCIIRGRIAVFWCSAVSPKILSQEVNDPSARSCLTHGHSPVSRIVENPRTKERSPRLYHGDSLCRVSGLEPLPSNSVRLEHKAFYSPLPTGIGALNSTRGKRPYANEALDPIGVFNECGGAGCMRSWWATVPASRFRRWYLIGAGITDRGEC